MKKLGFGMMRLPTTDPQDNSAVDYEKVKKLVDAYMERGFNYFDTAFKYCGGNSETAVRKAVVDRYPRDSYILTTKLSNEFMHSKEEQEQTFTQQLEKLGMDYVDYYLLHNQGAVNYKVSQELDSFAFIQGLKEKGLVKHIGMSYHDNAELLDEILTAHPELDVVQLQINYLDWDNESIQSRKCYQVCRKHGKPVLVMYNYQHDLTRIQQRFGKYSPENPSGVRELKTASDMEDWNAGKIPVAATQPASTGHGLNLQQGGSTIIWFGLNWSLELYEQANARLWRQGQKETVVVHHLVVKGTMDEQVMRALHEKAADQNALLAAVKARIQNTKSDQ